MQKEEVRMNRVFGLGTFLGDEGDDYFKKKIEVRVGEMAWSHACPIPSEVVKEYGAEWAEKRYSECNFVFGLVVDTAAKQNLPLYMELTSVTQRVTGENPDSSISTRNVPLSFWTEMSPMSTPWGYAIPRVLIEQMGKGTERNQKRILKTLEIIDQATKLIDDPIDLLINIADGVVKNDAKTEQVLMHVLSKEVLIEEGCKTLYRQILDEIKNKSPVLWNKYQEMRISEQWESEIIQPEDLK